MESPPFQVVASRFVCDFCRNRKARMSKYLGHFTTLQLTFLLQLKIHESCEHDKTAIMQGKFVFENLLESRTNLLNTPLVRIIFLRTTFQQFSNYLGQSLVIFPMQRYCRIYMLYARTIHSRSWLSQRYANSALYRPFFQTSNYAQANWIVHHQSKSLPSTSLW